MAEIASKDFVFVVPDRDLVRLAMREMRESKQKITVQAIASLSGLPVEQTIATMKEMQAEYERR